MDYTIKNTIETVYSKDTTNSEYNCIIQIREQFTKSIMYIQCNRAKLRSWRMMQQSNRIGSKQWKLNFTDVNYNFIPSQKNTFLTQLQNSIFLIQFFSPLKQQLYHISCCLASSTEKTDAKNSFTFLQFPLFLQQSFQFFLTKWLSFLPFNIKNYLCLP